MELNDYYLVVTENGTAKLTKNLSVCRGNDLLIDLRIEIPDILFERTRFVAMIEVDQKDVNPIAIPTAVSVENALKQAGLSVKLTIEEKSK